MLFAITKDSNHCYELCNIKSGFNYEVAVTLNIQEGEYKAPYNGNGTNGKLVTTKSISLPKGEYYLVYAGLNWGGPYNFKFEFNHSTYELLNNPKQPLDGVIWSQGNRDIKFEVLQNEMSLS